VNINAMLVLDGLQPRRAATHALSRPVAQQRNSALHATKRRRGKYERENCSSVTQPNMRYLIVNPLLNAQVWEEGVF